MLGAACDIVAGFNPFLTVPQAVRDLVVKTKHFIEGKRSKLDYVVAAAALVVIAAKEAQLVDDIARAGSSSVSNEGLIRILNSEDAVLRVALTKVLSGVT